MLRTLFKNELGQVRYASWEWTVMRLVFAVIAWLGTSHRLFPIPVDIKDHTDQEKANGLARLFNLDWVGKPVVEDVIQYVFLGLLVVYVIGRFPLIVSALLVLIHTLIGSIMSSPAKDHHATQIVGMVLLGQFLWFAWEAVRDKFFPQWSPGKKAGALDRPSGAIFFSQQMIAAAYTVSAISKWINSGGGIIPGVKWTAQVPNIAVQFEKNNLQDYYNALQLPDNAAFNQASIDFVINYPVPAMIVFGSAFYLELFAVLAILNRKMGLIYGIALVAMHLSINAVMHLQFIYFEAIVLIFFINLPWWFSRMRGSSKNAAMAAQ